MPIGYDAIEATNLPAGGDAYFGYVNGRWPDYVAEMARFPGKPIYGLTTNTDPIGQGVDVEPGDATIVQAAAVVRADLARGVDRPIVYVQAGSSESVVTTFAAYGLPRARYRLGTAHWGVGQHICGPHSCGHVQADGTQWLSTRTFDQWLLSDTFITAAPYPGPAPYTPTPGAISMAKSIVAFNQVHVFWVPQDGPDEGDILHRYWTGKQWLEDIPAGGADPSDELALIMSAASQLDVFVRSAVNHSQLLHCWYLVADGWHSELL